MSRRERARIVFDYQRFAHDVIEARTAKGRGWTRYGLSTASGVSVSTIQHIEELADGLEMHPRRFMRETLVMICSALDLKYVDYLQRTDSDG